jgi:hypothetical protein
VVLSQLPGGIHWVRLLFLNLMLLGIDSAFALLEGVQPYMTLPPSAIPPSKYSHLACSVVSMSPSPGSEIGLSCKMLQMDDFGRLLHLGLALVFDLRHGCGSVFP